MKKALWILSAVLVLVILIVISFKTCFNKPVPEEKDNSGRLSDSGYVKNPGSSVETQMKNVYFHIDSGIVLRIEDLRGRLLPLKNFSHPVFNNKKSYILEIYSAKIIIDMNSLSTLLNRYVFAYKGSSLKDIKVSTSGKQIKQEGSIKGISFTIISDVSVTPDGMIKLHPSDIKALGIEMKGLMKLLNIELTDLISGDSTYGLKIIKDDLFLDPALMLPPPIIKGHLKSIETGDGVITQEFFSKSSSPLKPDYSKTNYMYFHGGILTFGKLTMNDADMEIIDNDPHDPFDFNNDHYFEQLTSGYHKTTADDGLVIYMPDYSDLKKQK